MLGDETREAIRQYWSRLSERLNPLSDETLKAVIHDKIRKRNEIQHAMKYRLKVAELIQKTKVRNLLDFGCGVGGDGVWFAQKLGIRVTFADIVPSNVELVKRYAKLWGIRTKTVLIDNPTTFTFPERYDMIFSDGVLHHIPNVREVVENLTRFLKPNGVFVVMLYTFKHYLGCKGFLGYASRSESDPNNPYSRFYTRKLATQLFNGFDLVDSWTTYNGKFGWYVWRNPNAPC